MWLGSVNIRVVPMPLLEDAADTADSAGIDIGKYAGLCTNQIPRY